MCLNATFAQPRAPVPANSSRSSGGARPSPCPDQRSQSSSPFPALASNHLARLRGPEMATQTRELPSRHQKGKEGEIAREFERHRWLRWFAITSMLVIASLVMIALFGPVPDYKLKGRLPSDLSSPEFMQQLAALSASALQANTHIQELPNGVVFYEAELKAIGSAQKSINWEAYIFQKGEIAQRIVDALTQRARAGVQVNVVLDGVGSLSTPKDFFRPLRLAGGHVEWYHPVRFYNWPRANNRTHREL